MPTSPISSSSSSSSSKKLKTKHVSKQPKSSKTSSSPSLPIVSKVPHTRYQVGSRFTVQWDVSKTKSKKARWRLYSGTVLRSATLDEKTAHAAKNGESLSVLDTVEVAWKVKYDGTDKKRW